METAWPPTQGVTSVRVPRESTILPVSASIRINAPAQRVFGALLETSNYGRWNTFIPKVTIDTQPGHRKESPDRLQLDTTFTFHVVMNSAKPKSQTPASLKVSSISSPDQPSDYIPKDLLEGDSCFYHDQSKVYRVTWIDNGGLQYRMLQIERFHEVIVLGENECEVRTWECQGGVLAYVVRWLYGKVLEEKFQDWVTGLKKYCENA